MSFAISPAFAEQWYVEPKVRLYGFWEDNIRLTPENEIDSPGVMLTGDVEVGQRTESTEISLNSSAVAREYFNEHNLDTVDYYFDGRGAYRAERDTFELNAALDLDSTLTSEEETTGLVQSRTRRTSWSLAPRWTHKLTETVSVYTNASYRDVSYNQGHTRIFTDYNYGTLGGGASWGITERTALLGQLQYARYDAKHSDLQSDTYSVMAGVDYALSETLDARFLVGARNSDTSNGNSTGNTFDFSLTKQFEVGSLRGSIRRDLRPSGGGSGDLLETLGAQVAWQQRITSRWGWSLDASAYRNSDPTGNKSTVDRDYFTISPRISYRLDEEWSISSGYRYRYQKYDVNDNSAQANALFVTLRFVPLIER